MLLAGLMPAGAALAESPILAAAYAAPTTRYPHGVLGDAVEWGALDLTLADGQRVKIVLPEDRVFEDVAPRLIDVDLDGDAEVVVVESDQGRGARLAIHDARGLVAATPFIGQRFRWLAPVGGADLDGDGAVEIAFVDRPHLARVLRVWRFRPDGAGGGRLEEVAAAAGLTNHRIGEPDIAGGLRRCGGRIEMVTADAGWARIVATRLEDGQLLSRDLGAHRGRESFRAAMAC
ncbi:FG-GAP repeat domain-containing protein [Roseisalinus antarcticus]|uniref:FG-GAP repeat protein n=1 Tax=Roseisalinus antarcticus TaxID=254357 RepID=A0A1Y5SJG0_9RHOB|nr:VCBS repeat-containing protein [Roseisalinus antarcticus]SLN40513.1 hypothetical protein ROA7023_01585 [Roseisalinus antarcticus]